jgi:hypothetical protein
MKTPFIVVDAASLAQISGGDGPCTTARQAEGVAWWVQFAADLNHVIDHDRASFDRLQRARQAHASALAQVARVCPTAPSRR